MHAFFATTNTVNYFHDFILRQPAVKSWGRSQCSPSYVSLCLPQHREQKKRYLPDIQFSVHFFFYFNCHLLLKPKYAQYLTLPSTNISPLFRTKCVYTLVAM